MPVSDRTIGAAPCEEPQSRWSLCGQRAHTALCNYTARCGIQFRVVWMGLVTICGVGTRQDGLGVVILAALCRCAVLKDTLFVDCSASKTDCTSEP